MRVETVEVIEATDRQRAVTSLTLAFSSDPVMRWGWPDSERYLTYWPQIADAFGGGAFERGRRTAWRTVWLSRCGSRLASDPMGRP